MFLSIISAFASENRTIGKDGKLMWSLPEDLKRFKALTMNHYCITGRKTFENLPVLNGRRLIVLTSKKEKNRNGVYFASSLSEAFELCRYEEEVFCIGGGEVYNICMLYASKLYITEVYGTFLGDTFFPLIHENEFSLTSSEQGTGCTFKIYTRKKLLFL